MVRFSFSRSLLFALPLIAGGAFLVFSSSRAAEPEAPYIPPPLFTSPPTVSTGPSSSSSDSAPPAAAEPALSSPPPSLPPATHVEALVPRAPDLTPEDLLDHPADRVAEKVQGHVSPDVLPMEPSPPEDPLPEVIEPPAPASDVQLAPQAPEGEPVPASESLLNTSDTSVPEAPASPLPAKHIQGDPHVLLLYTGAATDLSSDLKQSIEENVLPRLEKNPNWRLEIRAFASPSADSQSGDRRISLARALSVRVFLREKGIAATRMDVRALGQNTDRKPYDRVDLVFLDHGDPVKE